MNGPQPDSARAAIEVPLTASSSSLLAAPFATASSSPREAPVASSTSPREATFAASLTVALAASRRSTPPAQRAASAQPPISLHIERVVVDGVALTAHQGTQLRAALELELGRLLRGQGAGRLRQSTASATLRAPPIGADASSSPARFGRAIAHSVLTMLETP